jgi:hypothetical protein
MKPVAIFVGVLWLAGGAFTAEERGTQASATRAPSSDAKAATPEELTFRLARLEQRAALLESALQRSDAAINALAKQVKTLADAYARMTAAVSIDVPGEVRIYGNLRLANNQIDDVVVVPCGDAGATTSLPGPGSATASFPGPTGSVTSSPSMSTAPEQQCTCPDARVVTGIQFRPGAVSPMPGPATYNAALVCGRL